MSQGRATFIGEEVLVRFTATCVDEPDTNSLYVEDTEVDSLTILDVEVDFAKLPDDLQAAILALADNLEFEVDEPDYDEPDYDD